VLRRGGGYLGLRGTIRQEAGNKLRNEEINNLYTSPNIIRMIKSRRMRPAHIVLVKKPEGKTLLGRPRH
jgi:hypothetical protein